MNNINTPGNIKEEHKKFNSEINQKIKMKLWKL